jgi:AAA domain-containing protein
MMNICFQCGIYRADKIIDPDGPVAICPECGYRHRFARLPLLIVSGASGAGKSTVCRILLGRLPQVVILDSDILWRSEFNSPEYGSPDFIDTWLRVCKNISQSGRPVVLFGAGVGVPDYIEPRVERRYFATVHYHALVCDDNALAERLRRRPKWRGSGEPAYIKEHQQFNQWFKTYSSAQPPIRLLDTTDLDAETAANRVELWINENLRDPGDPIRST